MTAALDHGAKSGRPRLSTGSPPPAQLGEEELDLFAIFRLIRRRIVFIALVTLLLTALQLPFIMDIRQTYTSQARLLIHKPLTAGLAGPAADSYAAVDPTTEVERLRANPIAERIVSDFRLDTLEEFNPPPPAPNPLSTLANLLRSLLSSDAPPPVGQTDPKNVVLSHYFDALWVSRSGISDVIELAFTSEDPKLAAQIPNAIIEVYLDELNGQIKGQIGKAKVWLSDRIEAQRRRVDELEAAAKAYREQQVTTSPELQSQSATRMLSLGARQAEILSELSIVRASIAAIETAPTLADKAAQIDSDRMVGLVQGLRTLQSDLAGMRQTYGDNFSFVVRKRQEIADTEIQMQDEVDRNLRSLSTRLAALDAEATAVDAGVMEARAQMAQASGAESDLKVMTDRVVTERAALSVLEEQRRSLENDATLPVAEVEILSPATVSRWPDGRGKKFYLIIGLVVSALVAITLAVLREMLDTSIRSQQQLRGMAGAVPAGLIPLMQSRRGRRVPDRILNKRNGAFLDAVRGLAMMLEKDRLGGPPRSILVTSAVPGEGKSTMALALAMHFAAEGRSVLLVDCDRRAGSVHTAFGVQPAPGMANYFAGDLDPVAVIRRDALTGVDFIPCGEHRGLVYPDPRQITRIVEYARERDQIVIFDSAPVLATSETARLASVIDRTLVIVRWGKTRRKMVELAVETAREATSDDILVAINQVNPRRQLQYGYKDAGVFAHELRKYHAW